MKTMGKNVLVVALCAIISGGIAIGTSSYILNQQEERSSHNATDAFKQPFRLTNYASVAAENTDFTMAAENSVHAVVHIMATSIPSGTNQYSDENGQYVDPFEFFFGNRGFQRQKPQPRVGSGSGVIISTDGYILTNNHVVDGATELKVTLNDNRHFDAKLVGTDPNTDIALLKIDAKDLPTIPFGNSENLKVGEWVLAIGNPFNLTSTVTAGIVSAKGRSIPSMGQSARSKIESFIQTDAAVNPGNSGGALVNTKGELIGINTAIVSETGNFAGYSFAVPISIAQKVANDLKQYGTVQRGVLGIMIRDANMLDEKEKKNVKVLEGAYVGEFTERSSAKEAGVEIGDVITAINDVKIKSANGLQEQINKYRPGDKIKVKIDRNGTTKTLNVELRNLQGNTSLIKGRVDSNEILGAAFKTLSDKQKQQYGVSYGIEVSGLMNGKMRNAGIRKGFIILVVNDQKITKPEQIETIVDKLLKGDVDNQYIVVKGFYPNERTKVYAIDLTE